MMSHQSSVDVSTEIDRQADSSIAGENVKTLVAETGSAVG